MNGNSVEPSPNHNNHIQGPSIQESGTVQSQTCTPSEATGRVSTAATMAPLSFFGTIRSITNSFLSAAAKCCTFVSAGLFQTFKMLNPFGHFAASRKDSPDRTAEDGTGNPSDNLAPREISEPSAEQAKAVDTYGFDVDILNPSDRELYRELSSAGRRLYADLQAGSNRIAALNPVTIEHFKSFYDSLSRQDLEVITRLCPDKIRTMSSKATSPDPLGFFESLSSFDGARHANLRFVHLHSCHNLKHITNIDACPQLSTLLLIDCPQLEAREAKEAILKMHSLQNVCIADTSLNDPYNLDHLTADDIHQIFCNNKNLQTLRLGERGAPEPLKLQAKWRACNILGTKEAGEIITRKTAEGIFSYEVCEDGAIVRKDVTEEQKSADPAPTSEGLGTEAVPSMETANGQSITAAMEAKTAPSRALKQPHLDDIKQMAALKAEEVKQKLEGGADTLKGKLNGIFPGNHRNKRGNLDKTKIGHHKTRTNLDN